MLFLALTSSHTAIRHLSMVNLLSSKIVPTFTENWARLWAVRHCGGVLEHPITSRLWAEARIRAGVMDTFGGLLVPVDQSAYGHAAQKRTGLYLVGCSIVPAVAWARPARTVESMCTAQRERTPVDLAVELVRAARSCA